MTGDFMMDHKWLVCLILGMATTFLWVISFYYWRHPEKMKNELDSLFLSLPLALLPLPALAFLSSTITWIGQGWK